MKRYQRFPRILVVLMMLSLLAGPFMDDAFARGGSSSSGRSFSGGGFSRSSGGFGGSKSSGSFFGRSSSSGSKSSGGWFGNSSKPSPAPTKPSGSGYGNSASKPMNPSGYGNSAKKAAVVGGAAAVGTAGYANSSTSGSKTTDSKTGYGNSASKSTSNVAKSNVPQTPLQKKMNAAAAKQDTAKAVDSYRAEQSKFKYASSGYSGRSHSNYRVNADPGTYHTRRNVYYSHYNYRPAPYAYQSYSSFGMLDAMFLWMMLDSIHDRQYASMAYHHQNDPDMQAWRKEADRLAKDNAELKGKLAAMDQEVKKMQGTPVDPSYVPADAGDIVFTEKAVQDQAAANVKAAPVVAQQSIPTEKKEGGHSLFFWLGIIALLAVIGVIGYMVLGKKRRGY